MSQAVAGFVAVATLRFTFGVNASSEAQLGSPALGEGVSKWSGIQTEFLITLFLVLVIVSVEGDPRVKASPAILVGAVLAVAVFIGFNITGGSANPTRAVAPLLYTGTFTDNLYQNVDTYVLAPLCGGAVGGLVHRLLSRAQKPDEEDS